MEGLPKPSSGLEAEQRKDAADVERIRGRVEGAGAEVGARPQRKLRRLFRHVDHMVDGSLHQIIRQVSTTTLGRHHSRATLVALEGVVVQHILTLGDTRTPGSLVACLRSASDTGTVACTANLREGLAAILRHCGTTAGTASSTGRTGI